MAYFLVKEKDYDKTVVPYLRERGYTTAPHSKGKFDMVNLIYINLEKKVYANGIPGIKVGEVIGDHAITFAEFQAIWNIYAKYEGRAPQDMGEIS